MGLYLWLNKLYEVAATEWAGYSLSSDRAALRTAVAEQVRHDARGRTASAELESAPKEGLGKTFQVAFFPQGFTLAWPELAVCQNTSLILWGNQT